MDNTKFAPRIPVDSSVEFIDKKGNIKNTLSFVINAFTSLGNRKIILDRSRNTYFRFISKRINNKNYYYTLDNIDTDSNGSSIITYRRVQPLSNEYEYGKNAEEIVSVIESDTITNSEDSESNPTTPEEPDTTSFYERVDKSGTAENPYEQAYSETYHSSMENVKYDENSLTSFEPNKEFKDADNLKICGTL